MSASKQPKMTTESLRDAAKLGDTPLVRVHLNAGLDLNDRSEFGCTPLYRAAWHDHLDTLEVLLRHGARVNLAKSDAWTPLHIASQEGHHRIVARLLQAGAEYERVTRKDGWAPLHLAASFGHARVVEQLLRIGADRQVTSRNGWTARDLAVRNGHDEIMHMLDSYEVAGDVQGEQGDGSVLLELTEMLGVVQESVRAWEVFEEVVAPTREVVDEVSKVLSTAETGCSQLDAVLDESEAQYEQHRQAALGKAAQGVLSAEDQAQLEAARAKRLETLEYAVDVVEKVAKVQQVCDQEHAGVEIEVEPCSIEQLVGFVEASQDAVTRIDVLREQVCGHAAALVEGLREMSALGDHVVGQLAGVLGVAAEKDVLQVAVSKAVHDNLAMGLSSSKQVDELVVLGQAVKEEMEDAAAMPALVERLAAQTQREEDEVDALEDMQSKLGKLVRRNRVTAEDKREREAAIGQQQRTVARLREEVERLERETQALAELRLPEAVQAVVERRNLRHVPEALRKLQATGLVRHRNLETDFEAVREVQLVSARYQLRVVRPIGDANVKVLKAFPAELFKTIRDEVVEVLCLEHPNVLHPELVFHDSGSDMVWVQYPHVAKGALDHWEPEVDSPEARVELLRGVFRDVVDGVCHLHASGVVHGALKPSNVLVGDGGRPVICDLELGDASKEASKQGDMYALGRLMSDVLLQGQPGLDVQWRGLHDLLDALLHDDERQRPTAEEARAHPFFGAANEDAGQRVLVDPRSAEAREVVTLFRRQGGRRYRVVRVERVENAVLAERFAAHVGERDEQLVFQGVKPQVVPLVVQKGFDVRFLGSTATRFSTKASFCASPAHAPADEHGVKWMLVAKVPAGDEQHEISDVAEALPVYVIGFM